MKGKRAQTSHYNFSISLVSTADEPVPAAGAVCILETTIVDKGLGTIGTDSGVSLSCKSAGPNVDCYERFSPGSVFLTKATLFTRVPGWFIYIHYRHVQAVLAKM